MRDSARSVLAISGMMLVAGALVSAGCGNPLSTADETQTAVAVSSTMRTATATADGESPTVQVASTATPPAPGTIVVSGPNRLDVDLVSPVYSPDGSKIMGGGAGGLEVGDADGSNLVTVAADATSGRWSPDSTMISVTIVHGGLTSPSQTADVLVMKADGSSPRSVGKSDFPAYVQFLNDGRLAYVTDQRLHLFVPLTGADTIVDTAAPIVNDKLAADVPFLLSGDVLYLTTMRAKTLSVQDLATGVTKQLTESIDGRRWSGYGWSPAGTLAYADIDSPDTLRIPRLHLYDPATASDRVLLRGQENGVFGGVQWVTPEWLAYVFYPSGTVAESLAEYQALNIATGETTLLFTDGLGFSLSGGGHRLIFSRSPTSTAPFSLWVATLSVRR